LRFSKRAFIAGNDRTRNFNLNLGAPGQLFGGRILLHQFSLPFGRVFGHSETSARLGEF
jgi:hypothetical protein